MTKITIAGALLLAACTAQQLQTAETDATKVQAALNAGCQTYATVVAVVNATPVALAPQAQAIEAVGSGACIGGVATADLLQKALADPTTQTWLENLSTQLSALKG